MQPLVYIFYSSPESPQSKLKSEHARSTMIDVPRGGGGSAATASATSDTNSCDTSADDNVERLKKELKVAREQILRECLMNPFVCSSNPFTFFLQN